MRRLEWPGGAYATAPQLELPIARPCKSLIPSVLDYRRLAQTTNGPEWMFGICLRFPFYGVGQNASLRENCLFGQLPSGSHHGNPRLILLASALRVQCSAMAGVRRQKYKKNRNPTKNCNTTKASVRGSV